MLKTLKRLVAGSIDLMMLPARGAYVHLLRVRSPQSSFDGFRFFDWTDATDSHRVFTRLIETLTVVRRVDPRRYARMKRDVPHITVARLPTAGTFVARVGGVFLNVAHVRNEEPTIVALTLVHEATHARIHRAGVRVSSRTRDRVETRCIAEELAFAARLGAQYAWLLDAVPAKFSAKYWTDDERFARRLAQLREAGLPDWYVSMYRALFRP